jgi:translation initiation factor IF-3
MWGGHTAIKVTTRINTQIRAKEVRLVDQDGGQVGIVPLEKAQELAQEAELDLVEVAPQADPPVCRIMDHGRLVYEAKRRTKLARKRVRHQEMKEVKLRPNTSQHDYDFKINHVREFLAKGHKVKLTVMYRGAEMRHFERGTSMLKRLEADLTEEAEIETTPSSRGRSQSMVISPRKSKLPKPEPETPEDSEAGA